MTKTNICSCRVSKINKKISEEWNEKLNDFCSQHHIDCAFIIESKERYLKIPYINSSSSFMFIKNKRLLYKSDEVGSLISTNEIINIIKTSFIRSSKLNQLENLNNYFQTPLFWPNGSLFGFFVVFSNACLNTVKKEIDLFVRELSCDILSSYYSKIAIAPVGKCTEHSWCTDMTFTNEDRCTFCDELILITDLNNKILSYNQNAFSHLGYKVTDLIGANITSIIKSCYKVSFYKHKKDVISKNICSFTMVIYDKKREELTVDVVSQIVNFNEADVIVHVIKNRTLEISILKAIQRSERILTEGKFITSLGYWVWEIGTNHIHLSESVRKILGFSYESKVILLKELASRIHKDDKEKVSISLKQTLKTKKPAFLEFRVLNESNTYSLLQCRREAITNSKGEVVQLVSTIQDITKQRTFENAFDVSKNNNRNLFESVCEGFFFYTYSKENVFTYVSPGAQTLLGRPLNEIIGSNWRNSIDWVESDELNRCQSDSNDSYSKILEYIHPNGSRRALLCSSISVKDCDGDVLYYQGFAQDITKQKALESEILIAKENAELLSNEKSRILANLNHEMRTPLNAISGIIHLMNDPNLTYQQRKYLEKLQVASNWLNDIINNTLDFSKIEAGKIALEKIEFSLRSNLAKSVELFEQRVGQKDLMIKVEVSDLVPDLIVGDPVRTVQIINNFISNAIKFTDYGVVMLEVSCHEVKDNLIDVKFTVKDTGIGIAQDKINKIFQAFTQADETTTREYGGTGLGLTICKQLAELMKGKIYVKSTLGVGSEFSVVLPYLISENNKKDSEVEVAVTNEIHKALIVGNKDTGVLINSVLNSLDLTGEILDTSIEGLGLLKNINSSDYVLFVIDLSKKDLIVSRLFDFIIKSGILNAPTIIIKDKKTDIANNPVLNKMDKVKVINTPLNTQKVAKVILQLINEKDIDPNLIKNQIKGIKNMASDSSVLVVEDVKINQLVVEELLKKCNLNVQIANNGLEALEYVKRNNYSLILMDIEMPLMDGYTTTKKIREIDKDYAKKVPIIAMTAHTLDEDIIFKAQSGLDDYITKPLNPKIFYAIIRKWLAVNKLVKFKPKTTIATELWFEKLKQVPLFKLNDVMEVVEGNYKLYKNLLLYFLSYLQESRDKLLVDMYNRNESNIRHTIHDLKGISGTIGAYQLAEKSVLIEKCFKHKSDDLLYELAGYGILMKKYINELEQLFVSKEQNVIIV